MNVLVEIDFPDGTQYFAKEQVVVSGNQYLDYINSVSPLSEAMGLEPGFEVSGLTVIFDDVNRHFRILMASLTNRIITEVAVRLKKADGTLLRTFELQTFDFPQDQFRIDATNKLINMGMDISDRIDSTRWPNAFSGSINETIPRVYNDVNYIKAWNMATTAFGPPRVHDTTETHTWLLGPEVIDAVETVANKGVVIGGFTVDSIGLYNNGVPTSEAVSGTTYYYLNMNDGGLQAMGDFCWVKPNQSGSLVKPVAMIIDLLAGFVTVDTNASFSTYLDGEGYSTSTVAYMLSGQKTAKQLLIEFCNSVMCNFYFDSQNKVQFSWYDSSTVTGDLTFQTEKVISYRQIGKADHFVIQNEIEYFWNWNYQNGVYDNSAVYTGPNQGTWGEHRGELEMPFITDSTQAQKSADRKNVLFREPLPRIEITLGKEMFDSFTMGNFIRFAHPNGVTQHPMFYRIHRITKDFDRDIIALELIDYTYLSRLLPLLTESGVPILTEDGKYIYAEGI